MHHHASLTANLPSLSLASLFQAAAGKAWARTRPTRAYHRTSVRAEGVVHSTLRTVHRENDDATEIGGPSTSASPNPAAASPSLHDCRLRVPSSVPHFAVSPLGHQAAPLAADAGTNAVQASPCPAPSHSPRRNFVTPVNVESLSPGDLVSDYDNQPLSSAYESDPPWEEIRDSVPEWLLPRIHLHRHPIPKQFASIPEPSTWEELLANLTLAATAESPPSLGQLQSYHASHRALNSTASFNLLIRMAIRNASFGTVKYLLGHMVREGIPGDLETRTLRVRCMVRTGFWRRAWREELVRERTDGVGMPLPVWLEFFGDVKRGAILSRPVNQGGGRAKAKGMVPLLPPDHSVSAGRVNALLQHPPLVTQTDSEKVPPRVVYAVVRSLVALDRQQAAIALTTSYFQSLPHELDAEWRRGCLSIIHLCLKPGRRRALSEHYAARATLLGFLRMHHSFLPSSTTLFFLLQSLRYSRRCGERAEAVAQSFAKRWGPDIVDDAVRRRIASYWIKQGNIPRAQQVCEVQDWLDEQRVGWRAEKEVIVGDSFKDRARRLRWLDLHRAPRKTKIQRLWRMVRRRLRRAQVRRS
ncbi:hypothetical protein C8Q79DRAFT_899487 [Trametes meyenii]|nr:hypothetical protein C8Q79DRAFT_899487 [Trametes meyenii]